MIKTSHLILMGFFLLWPCGVLGETDPAPKKIPDVQLNTTGLSPSEECGKCHQDIYQSWKNSLHAQATGNPVFWAALLQSYYKSGEIARRTCFACHAPIAFLNGDFELNYSVTNEGINCDFCHTISSAYSKTTGPKYLHEIGLLKQGPLKNVRSPVHLTRFNALYQRSDYCAGCHDYESPDGVKLIETFSEWQNSPYKKKGIHCQYCHMGKVGGKIVGEEILKVPETEISSHDIAGGHSLSMREKTLKLNIRNIRVHRQKIVVTLDLTNEGAGHKIPTGLPSKKLVLEVTIKSKNGETAHIQQKVYQKLIEDKNGQPVIHDADLMLAKGLRVISDNRIGPRETRRETFTFFVPHPEDQQVTAAVYYIHNPRIIQPSPIRIKMKEVTQSIGP